MLLEWQRVCGMPGVTEKLVASPSAECGHIGCCDGSPSQHASKHAAATGHPIIGSFEPGEDWFFDFEKQRMVNGVELLPKTLASGGSTRARTVRKSPSQLGIAPALAGVNHFSFDRYERWRTENEQGPHGGFQRWSARQDIVAREGLEPRRQPFQARQEHYLQ
jgi:hypothetical protein